MTRHVTTAYVDAMKELCDTDDQSSKAHKEHGASRMDRDERDIHKIMEAVEQRQNPFDLDNIPEELINIASGQVASEKVKICQMLKNHQHISLMAWLFYRVSMIQPFKRSMTWVSVSGKRLQL